MMTMRAARSPPLQKPRPALAPVVGGGSRSAWLTGPPCVASPGQPGPNEKKGWDMEKVLSVATFFGGLGGLGYYIRGVVSNQLDEFTKEFSAKLDYTISQGTEAATAATAQNAAAINASVAAINASVAATNAASNFILVMAFMAILAIVFAKNQDGK